MFGPGPGPVVAPQEDVKGHANQSDGMVKAWLTHPDGRVEFLTRGREGNSNESSV